MNISEPHVQRGWMLLNQNRPALAEEELRQALIQHPDYGFAHALLALALSRQGRHQEANDAAESAVGLSPDDGFPHYVHSCVLAEGHCFPEAERAIRHAITLDSAAPAYFAQLASLMVQAKRWPEALAVAEQGLELDPEHDACVNLRSMALTALGRKAEASQTLRGALERDPDDGWTHANLGWTLIEEGKPAQAMEHFREALRLEPDLEHARLGIITAMKAKSFLYRPLLWYFLWAQKIQGQYMWTFIIGFYLLMNGLRRFAKANPAWEPWVWPIIGVYLLFVYSTWLGNALFNLVLYTNRFGRLVLSEDEKRTSFAVGAMLLLTIGLVGCAFGFQFVPLLFAAVATLLATLPISLIHHAEAGWPRWAIGGMAVLLLAMGFCPVITVALVDILPDMLLVPLALLTQASLASLGFAALGTQILSQVLVNRHPRRITPRRM